ncbi:MAG: hypothetical protein JSW46_20015 [Gemmatimonadota bacterium]|nr:MAG: hypothetical protein JSW46_20015 [Gemmatimonadota bacterium]
MGNLKRILGAVVALIVLPAAGYGQEAYLELMRQDIKTQKVAIVTQAMELSDEQAEAFWPVYREYQYELDKIGDERIALIKDYAEHFEMMTDEKAGELAGWSFRLQEQRLQLRKRFHAQFEQAVGAIAAAKFMQVDNALTMLLDLQIASSLPLVEAPPQQN